MPDAYVVVGGRPLRGEVSVGGAKNSALYLMASALLAPGQTVLERVPRIGDIQTMVRLVQALGARGRWAGPHRLELDVPETLGGEAAHGPGSMMRASIAVLGPLLARTGRATVAMPGGCDLGTRGIDLHLRGLEELGAEVGLAGGHLVASAPDGLRGRPITLDYPSHGATANLLMAAVLAEGVTVIENASREPEIAELAAYLQAMGARIEGAGTCCIEVEGTTSLSPTTFEVMPDRLEAGTYLFAAAAAGGDVVVRDCRPDHLELVLAKLIECGARIEIDGGDVSIASGGRCEATDISTLPYPGFPTDLMPLAVACLSRSDGLSIVTENIFDARFTFTDELVRMGADVRIEGHYAAVRGVAELRGVPVRAPDIRAGAALVIAGLAARGRTIVEDVHLIERGYEDLPGRLAGLGAEIVRGHARALSA